MVNVHTFSFFVCLDCALSVEFDPVLPPNIVTNSIALNHHSDENPFTDNIYLNKTIQKQFTGKSQLKLVSHFKR